MQYSLCYPTICHFWIYSMFGCNFVLKCVVMEPLMKNGLDYFAFEGLKSRINHKIDIKTRFYIWCWFLFAHINMKNMSCSWNFFPRLKMKYHLLRKCSKIIIWMIISNVTVVKSEGHYRYLQLKYKYYSFLLMLQEVT